MFKESIECQIFLDCSSLLNSFQQFISFVICFLVSGIVMGFKEWNLNMALYYGGFNFIISFHFQYSASDRIIFGYNNISMIFSMCVKSKLFCVRFHIHPLYFLSSYRIYFDLLFSPLLVLWSIQVCVLHLIAFHSLLHFFIFHYNLCVLGNMVTFHVIRCLELTIMVDDSGTTSMSKQCLCAICFHFS